MLSLLGATKAACAPLGGRASPPSWHLGALGCGGGSGDTSAFICCGLEWGASSLRRGKTVNRKSLESPLGRHPVLQGFRWKLVTEKDCVRRRCGVLPCEAWEVLRVPSLYPLPPAPAAAGPQATSKFFLVFSAHLCRLSRPPHPSRTTEWWQGSLQTPSRSPAQGQQTAVRLQRLKTEGSPNSSPGLTPSLYGRAITETGERKTNLPRRNFILMTPFIISFLIRKSSRMRRLCQLIGFSISTRTILARRISGVGAHQAQASLQCPVSLENNADSRVQWKTLSWHHSWSQCWPESSKTPLP